MSSLGLQHEKVGETAQCNTSEYMLWDTVICHGNKWKCNLETKLSWAMLPSIIKKGSVVSWIVCHHNYRGPHPGYARFWGCGSNLDTVSASLNKENKNTVGPRWPSHLSRAPPVKINKLWYIARTSNSLLTLHILTSTASDLLSIDEKASYIGVIVSDTSSRSFCTADSLRLVRVCICGAFRDFLRSSVPLKVLKTGHKHSSSSMEATK